MKHVLGFWVIGCIISGLVLAKMIKECPTRQLDMKELLVVSATWPAFMAAAIALPSGTKLPTSECVR